METYLPHALVTPRLLRLLLALGRPFSLTPATGGWRVELAEPDALPPIVVDPPCVGLAELSQWLNADLSWREDTDDRVP